MKPLTKINTATGRLLILLAFGLFALRQTTQAVSPPPDGGYAGGNTAEGQNALLGLTTGTLNTAIGFFSLRSNTEGKFSTSIGAYALFANTAEANTATGAGALLSNTTGSSNTADGVFTLFSNISGFDNTAIGDEALLSNTTGNNNTAIGGETLLDNTQGSDNTAAGRFALRHNISGDGNTAYGLDALVNTTGNDNTALGVEAGANLDTGDNNIDIGANVTGVAGESNTIRIGNTNITDTFVRGISRATAAGGAAVFVASNGHLGTMTSSARFKDEIKPMGNASEAILALRPVSFRYKKEIDPQGMPEFGLIAEEVEKVNPDLITRDKEGKPYTVRYEQVNAMLLNEFLKAHRKMEQEQNQIDALTARL
jgi:Chaperone of endosialidase